MIGKLKSVRFGFGGYQDAMLGFSFELGGKGWGVGDFKGTWATWSKGCKWTVEDQRQHFAKSCEFVRGLLRDADAQDMGQLVGKPIEVEFEQNNLKSWRILTEAI